MLKIFRIITSLRFYAGIACMIFLMFIWWNTNVLSFRRLPSLSVSTTLKQSDTHYISQQKIAHYVVALTYANIEVWHGEWWWISIWGMGTMVGSIINQALVGIQNLQLIQKIDILQLQNSDKSIDGIATFIQQGQTTIQQSQWISSELQWVIADAQAKVDACTVQKTQADELYRQWLTAHDAVIIDQATTQAQEASVCISTYSVTVKSNNWILLSLAAEIERTQKYITLAQNNSELIRQYWWLVAGEVPAQLVQLKKDISSL